MIKNLIGYNMKVLTYSSDIKEIKQAAELKFGIESEINQLYVRDILCHELYNVIYFCEYDENVVDSTDIKAHSKEDEVERAKLLAKTSDYFDKYMAEDVYTRQFVIQMKYDDDPDKASCLSLVQFSVRDGFLNLNIYARSQNFENNFIYDNQTYMKMMRLVINKIDDAWGEWMPISFGTTTVHINSLHKFV